MIQISGLNRDTYKKLAEVLDGPADILQVIPEQLLDMFTLQLYDHVHISNLPDEDMIAIYSKIEHTFFLHRSDFYLINIW